MLRFVVSDSGLLPAVNQYLTGLVARLEQVPAAHPAERHRLAQWIARQYRSDAELPLIVVCTGNSRRSVLLSTLLNLAAAYCGLPAVRGYSGGTHPSAVNSRTITALRAMGVEVLPVGTEASRGEVALSNPKYRFYWGRTSSGKPLETVEFSKTYADLANPQSGFAALMVCDEADAGCPVVSGAALRISVPFVDPKSRDGLPDEAEAYAACRDDLGCLALAIVLEARGLIETNRSTGSD